MYGTYEPEVLDRLHRIELMMLRDFNEICDTHGIDYFVISGTAIGAVRHQGFIPWDDDIDIAMTRDDYERFVSVLDTDPVYGAKYELWGHERKHRYYNLIPELMLRDTVCVNEIAEAGGYRPGIMIDLFIYDHIPDDPREAKKVIDRCRFFKTLYLARNINYGKFATKDGGFTGVKDRILAVIYHLLRLIPKSDELLYRAFMKAAGTARGRSDTYTCLYDTGPHIMGIKGSKSFPTTTLPFEDTTVRAVKNYRAQLARHMGRDYMTLPPEEKRTNHCPVELDFGPYKSM